MHVLSTSHSLLPVEVVVTDNSSEAPLEIMKPVLVVAAVTSLPSVPVIFINHNLHLDSLSLTLFRNLKSFWEDSLTIPNSPTQVSIIQVGLTQVSFWFYHILLTTCAYDFHNLQPSNNVVTVNFQIIDQEAIEPCVELVACPAVEQV